VVTTRAGLTAPSAINIDVDLHGLVGLVGGIVAFSVAFLWARWLRRRAVAPRFAAWAAYALLAFSAFAPFASCAMAIETLGSIGSSSVDPSQRATLGGGLGTASVSLFSRPILLAGAATFLLALLVLVGATGRWHWFPRSFGPKNDPPYR
jgi:hypothetical protein